MSDPRTPSAAATAILVVDGDIVVRHATSEYLRYCGYAVVEAANIDEAMTALNEPTLSLDIIICDVAAIGPQSGFKLASWVRAHKPSLEVRPSGTLEGAAGTAADLCETGPRLTRPYEPEAVVKYVKRLRAEAARHSV